MEEYGRLTPTAATGRRHLSVSCADAVPGSKKMRSSPKSGRRCWRWRSTGRSSAPRRAGEDKDIMPHILHLIRVPDELPPLHRPPGYLLASRVNQSAVIGEILLGLVAGPSVLGIITYTDFVSSIAHLGAVVLLFVVGLEFRLEGVVRRGTFLSPPAVSSHPGQEPGTAWPPSSVTPSAASCSSQRRSRRRASPLRRTSSRNGALKTAAARAIIGAAGHFVFAPAPDADRRVEVHASLPRGHFHFRHDACLPLRHGSRTHGAFRHRRGIHRRARSPG